MSDTTTLQEGTTTLQEGTRQFLNYLQKHPEVRAQIAAPPNQTVVYCGDLLRPAFHDYLDLRSKTPELRGRPLLPELLANIGVPDQTRYSNLLEWIQAIQPYQPDGFIAWRAVSGLMCRQAKGKVTFIVGRGVSRDTKVFAATEVWNLAVNPHLHPETKELVAFYKACVLQGRTNIGISYVPS